MANEVDDLIYLCDCDLEASSQKPQKLSDHPNRLWLNDIQVFKSVKLDQTELDALAYHNSANASKNMDMLSKSSFMSPHNNAHISSSQSRLNAILDYELGKSGTQ